MKKVASWFIVLVLSCLALKSSAFQHVSPTESKLLTHQVRSGWRQPRMLPNSSRIPLSPSTTSRLSSSPNGANNAPDRPSRGPNRISRLIRRIINFQARLVARFRALPAKAKRVFVAQWMIVFLIFGAVAKNTVIRPTPTPIEISYSKFLHLIEQQQNSNQKNVPVMDQVRIGTDRIIYRLYPATPQETEKSDAPIIPADNTKPSLLARYRSRPELPKSKTSAKSTAAAAAAAAARPYVTAYTRKVAAPPELVSALHKNDIHFAAASQARASTLAMILRSAVASFYFLILWRLYRSVSSAGGGGKGEVPGKLAKASDLPLASFDEIEGIDEVKAEVMELVDTIRHPEKYAILGARAPTGILLEGPSGTGKTMLARATAATAGVPLIYCSGSDFVEMFVGRGAARVRKLFEKAAKLAPCIIFIDELDALGKARDSTVGGMSFSRSNDEAEQTLNQLLACMDGLDSTRGISVLAATNRRDVLDPALVRPGRFDRIVQVKLPDAAGREKILRVHCKKLPGFTEGSGVDPDRPGALGKGRLVDLAAIAAVTEGLSGAELEFLVNEAAIRAVRRVSRALHKGGAAARDIVPHVEAVDFEASVANFYATRRPKGAANLFKNVWK